MGYIKLNKQSFFHNLDYFSSICTKDKLSIALKDNAYGHGTYETAVMCKEYGIKHIFVRTMKEAELIEQFGFESVLVLYDIPKSYNPNAVISINSLEDIKKLPRKTKCEIKIDTGMNRNGILKDEIKEAVSLIKENHLVVNGIFTHFCCADEDNDITLKQEKLFLEAVEELKKYICYGFRTHCANSAGAHIVDMSKYDLARIGIGAYGYLDDMPQQEHLKPVMSLHGEKIATKHIKKGDHIGYGSRAYVAPCDMTVSNYNIGYGDGFFRFDEKTKTTIQDGRDILGRVSMDSFSVKGDDEEVVVFDNVTTIAKSLNTITYTILAMLNGRIPRIVSEM
jgi:alanine racemase